MSIKITPAPQDQGRFPMKAKKSKNPIRRNQVAIELLLHRADKAEAEFREAAAQSERFRQGLVAAQSMLKIEQAKWDVEREELRIEFERARTYTGLEGKSCPLCRYENGMLLEVCQPHQLCDRVSAQLRQARADLDAIARVVYPDKPAGFTYSVQFMVEEIQRRPRSRATGKAR